MVNPRLVRRDVDTRVEPERIGVPLRTALKPLIKSLLWRPLHLLLRCSNRRAGIILLYHDIGDRDGEVGRELVPPTSRTRFARQLEHLRRYYRFVDLSDLQAAAAARRRGEPFPVAVTFDDDLGHHVTHALPELHAAEASATFFLCGSFLDEPRDYWWQRLQRAVDDAADVTPLVGAGTIHEQGRVMEELEPVRRDAVADELGRLASPVPQCELLTTEGACQLPRIGFHTIRHDTLTRLDDEQLARALADGRSGLAKVAGRPIDAIAYPHGRFDSRVLAAARDSDFAIGLTCEREAVTAASDPLALGRYEPPPKGLMGEFAYDLVRTLLSSPL